MPYEAYDLCYCAYHLDLDAGLVSGLVVVRRAVCDYPAAHYRGFGLYLETGYHDDCSCYAACGDGRHYCGCDYFYFYYQTVASCLY